MTCLAAGNIITVLILELMPWVSACGHLSVLLMCYLVLFVFLRIKRRDFITGLIGELQLDSEGSMISLSDVRRGMLRGNLQPWDESPLPFPRDRAVDIVPEVVIVELPNEPKVIGLPMTVLLRKEE